MSEDGGWQIGAFFVAVGLGGFGMISYGCLTEPSMRVPFMVWLVLTTLGFWGVHKLNQMED